MLKINWEIFDFFQFIWHEYFKISFNKKLKKSISFQKLNISYKLKLFEFILSKN